MEKSYVISTTKIWPIIQSKLKLLIYTDNQRKKGKACIFQAWRFWHGDLFTSSDDTLPKEFKNGFDAEIPVEEIPSLDPELLLAAECCFFCPFLL